MLRLTPPNWWATLLPPGATLVENVETIDEADARQLSCTWSTDSQSLTLVFAVNVDPSDRVSVVSLNDAEQQTREMGWEVDVDVTTDSYQNTHTDELGGELKTLTTVDGSLQQLSLQLPGDVHVSSSPPMDISQEDMDPHHRRPTASKLAFSNACVGGRSSCPPTHACSGGYSMGTSGISPNGPARKVTDSTSELGAENTATSS